MSQFANPLAADSAQYDDAGDLAGAAEAGSRLDRRVLLFLGLPQIVMLTGVSATGLSGGVLGVVQIGVLLPSLAAALVYPFYGIAMLFLIFPFDDLLELGGMAGHFTISKLMAIATTLGYAFRTAGGRYSLLPVEKVGAAAALLATVILLSAIWAEAPLAALLRGMTPILLAVLVCYGTQLIDTRERWETILTALILSGMIAAIMMTFLVGDAATARGSEERIFLGGEVNPNHTGVIMTISAYVCFVVILAGRSHLMRTVAIVTLPVLGIAVLLTKSRASTVAFPFGLCVGIFFGMRQNFGVKLLSIAAIILLGLGTFLFAGAVGLIDVETIFSRWQSTGSASEVRATIRRVGLAMWQDAPFLGHGYGMYDMVYTRYATAAAEFGGGLARDPHNLWIKIAAELGVVGLLAMLWLILAAWIVAFQIPPSAGRFLIIAILSAIGTVTLSSSVIIYKYSWYSIMVIGATARLFSDRSRGALERNGHSRNLYPVEY